MKSNLDAKGKSGRRPIYPLSGQNDIKQVRSLLKDQPRNLLLFDLAVETGLRIKDLLQLKVKDVQELAVGDEISVTGSEHCNPVISENIHQTLQYYLREIHPQSDEYLFKSRKKNSPLNVSSVSDIIKSWFKAAGLNELTGAKSLRKTWEVNYKTGLADAEDSDSSRRRILNPLKAVTLQEMAYQELLNAIITRKIEPGQILVTDKLAREMRISNRPVREALARLAQGGFVISQKRQGFVVVELSKDNLIEILKIRIRLETMAGEVAALSRTVETMNRLDEIYQQLVKADHRADLKKIYQNNRDFHFTVYEAANMSILLQMISGLWDRWAPYYLLILENRYKLPEITKKNLDIHYGILEGMKCRDPAMVGKALEQDLTWVIRELIDTISI